MLSPAELCPWLMERSPWAARLPSHQAAQGPKEEVREHSQWETAFAHLDTSLGNAFPASHLQCTAGLGSGSGVRGIETLNCACPFSCDTSTPMRVGEAGKRGMKSSQGLATVSEPLLCTYCALHPQPEVSWHRV